MSFTQILRFTSINLTKAFFYIRVKTEHLVCPELLDSVEQREREEIQDQEVMLVLKEDLVIVVSKDHLVLPVSKDHL